MLHLYAFFVRPFFKTFRYTGRCRPKFAWHDVSKTPFSQKTPWFSAFSGFSQKPILGKLPARPSNWCWKRYRNFCVDIAVVPLLRTFARGGGVIYPQIGIHPYPKYFACQNIAPCASGSTILLSTETYRITGRSRGTRHCCKFHAMT